MSATQTTSLAPTPLELAILGQLKATGGTCDALTALPVERKSSMRQRVKACQQLQARGWLAYDHDIAQFGLTLTGKTLLKLDLSVWPVTPDELMILRSCQGGRISPSQIHRRVSVGDRQRLLERLAAQGLIVVYERAVVNLHLTPEGSRYWQ
ncbi:hypothetical protein [Phormidium tenue]|uniref:Uncharacterized protein n=1 Tax=Phormidium tenue NIES-30 TaxID=549789 RepID=A0A1U7J3Y4_9CYAN|nr:hypothetical protein [Phormidium tenue]MBD2233012.1 hypothetical protein [Phormidium tenue FACHB-1052]OKH47167.1 hypothetical protein NIES30_14435 [Phormidium tenue NIES-30]